MNVGSSPGKVVHVCGKARKYSGFMAVLRTCMIFVPAYSTEESDAAPRVLPFIFLPLRVQSVACPACIGSHVSSELTSE